MGNSQPTQNGTKYTQKDNIDDKILQKKMINQHLLYLQKNKNNNSNIVNKTVNHLLNNPEVQNTFLKNRTMQKQLIEQLKIDSTKQKTTIDKTNYNSVNSYLNNLNVDYSDTDPEDNTLYINQSDSNKNIINDLDFIKTEEELAAKFKLDEEKRHNLFRQQQQKRREMYKEKISEFNKSSVNPYQLFRLTNTFTLDQLNKSYKQLAILTHHDRPNGSTEKFKIVTKAYLALMEDYKTKQSDKQYFDLRDESNNYIETQRNDGYKNIDMTNEKFNINEFNQIYDSNRLGEATDDGYNDWIQNNQYDTEDIKKNDIFSDKFNINVFNSVFDKETKTQKQDIVEYKIPEALNSSNSNLVCSELGLDKINNFSKESMTNGDLNYMDYRQAYSNTHLIDPNTKYTKYKNIEDLKKSRSKINKLSEEELRKEAYYNKKKELADQQRLENIRRKDILIRENYGKVNKLLLKTIEK